MQLNDKQAVFLLSFLLFLSPSLIRAVTYSSDNFIGFTTYFHVRMADVISSGQYYDHLSYGGRPLTYPPGFPVLLSFFPGLFKLVLNPLAGALVALLFYEYAVKRLGHKQGQFALFFLITSPGFIYISSHINPRLIAFLLIFAMYYLLAYETRYKHLPICLTVLAAAAVLIHPLVFVVGITIGMLIFRGRRHLIMPASIGLVLLLSTFFVHGFPQPSSVYANFSELQKGVQYFLFESGAAASSVSVVTWIVGLTGFFYAHKKMKVEARWLAVAIAAPLLFGNRLNEFVYYPLALFASVGFFKIPLILKEFRIPFNERIVKSVVAAYLIVIALYYPLFFSNVGPPKEDFLLLSWAKTNLPENATIFGDFTEGHWITQIAGKKDFWDAYVEYAPEVNKRNTLALEVLNGYEPALKEVVCNYNVSYAYLHVYPYMAEYHHPVLSLFNKHGRVIKIVGNGEEYAVLYELDREQFSC